MFEPSEFRELISGRRRGAASTVLRGLLRAAEVPYSLAVQRRNRRYDLRRTATQKVDVPVVSVGNLTLGGTGKTPMVKWIAKWAGQCGIRAAIVSRGYGAGAGEPNDEARELAQALPNVPHVQNPDRVAAARKAIDEFSASLILLDDGFQHRRLARDLDIVLLDALQPFGFDHVFPRGMLREPVAGLSRAGVVCLSRANLVTPAERAEIRERVAQLAPWAVWCEATHAPSDLIDLTGKSQSVDALRGRRVAAFCGLGNPAGFRHTLESTGCKIVSWREFSDHHTYSRAECNELHRTAKSATAEMLVCTQKDLVKIDRQLMVDPPLWAIAIDLRFLNGEQEMRIVLGSAVR